VEVVVRERVERDRKVVREREVVREEKEAEKVRPKRF
jgi:hypothetical protein